MSSTTTLLTPVYSITPPHANLLNNTATNPEVYISTDDSLLSTTTPSSKTQISKPLSKAASSKTVPAPTSKNTEGFFEEQQCKEIFRLEVDPKSVSQFIGDFLNPRGKWVLVPDGSFRGMFNWVPIKLRVGQWSPLSSIFIFSFIAAVIYTKPQSSIEFDEEALASFPPAFSAYWYYNFFGFLWTSFVIMDVLFRDFGPLAVLSYTCQSWAALTIRHGISAIAPFLPNCHGLLRVHEFLRFHCLATATITFTVWNFVMMPLAYFRIADTEQKRKGFLRVAFKFNLCQTHLFNILFALLNTIISSPRMFTFTDLWCSMAALVAYMFLYLVIMDRLGAHCYALFSPRSALCILSFSGCLGCYFATYYVWNIFIAEFVKGAVIA